MLEGDYGRGERSLKGRVGAASRHRIGYNGDGAGARTTARRVRRHRMDLTRLSDEEIARRGQEIYDQSIRARVEPEHRGKFLIVNVETGEYEMDADDVTASIRAKEKYSDAPLFTIRVGYPTAYRMGGRFLGRIK
jgi:hypothetical protein